MLIPFSPPHIDQAVVDAVTAALQSGWITTGPRTKQFEVELAAYCGVSDVLCVNSASAGLELMLRFFGVSAGDEVIVPAYTYCATANVVVHCGATPVMVDVDEDFTIDVDKVKAAITPRTKVIMPVDIAGFPCNYDELNELVNCDVIRQKFMPRTSVQHKLGRIMILSDAAHSLGAQYGDKHTGALTDVTVFSFHAVKNLTTAEGGAVCLNFPAPFDNEEVYKKLRVMSLHGQSKDALAKTQIGNWRYDVTDAGYKCNMPDVLAAIGLAELQRYEQSVLPRRKAIFDAYSYAFSKMDTLQIPTYKTPSRLSSYHVYPLRIKNISEAQRDAVMQEIFNKEVCVNVHFIPLPMLSFYKNQGYNIEDYPVTYDNYAREISLPVYYDLTDNQVQTVIQSVMDAVHLVCKF